MSTSSVSGLRRSVAAVVSLFVLTLGGNAFGQGTFGAIPQKNVNAVGPTPPNWLLAGNPRMQQNEPEGACSPNNPNWCAIGMNDYRAVNFPAVGDSFPGIAMTRDGLTWISGLHPGHLADIPNINKKAGADPNLEAVPGMLFYNFIALWRDDSQPGGVYLSRWYEHNRETGPPWEHLDNIQIDLGTPGRFLDKPAFEVAYKAPGSGTIAIDIPQYIDPRNPANVVDAYTLNIPAVRLHLCYAVFVGNDNNDGTRINCVASDDGGVTWPIGSKLTEGVEINQGVSLATKNNGLDVLAVWTRFRDNNEDYAIMYAYSSNGGETWSKADVLTKYCPFNQPTGPARHRTNALPVAASDGDRFSVFFASRNDGGETCLTPGKGNNPPEISMSPVLPEDDFDSFGETRIDGVRQKDNMVRTSLNFSRILMIQGVTQGNGINWDNSGPRMVDPYTTTRPGDNVEVRRRGHQYMPATEAAGGIVTVSWYDSRLDRLNLLNGTPLPSGYVDDLVVHFDTPFTDPVTGAERFESAQLLPAGVYELEPPPISIPPPTNNIPLRRNIDTFAAQIVGTSPRAYNVDDEYYPTDSATGSPSPSTRVSRFAKRPKRDPVTNEIIISNGKPVLEQVEYNFPNARLFRKGKAPFIGDYNTVFAVQARRNELGQWVSNQTAVAGADFFPSLEPVFHIGWTSNHEVRGRVFYTGCDQWNEAEGIWEGGDSCASEVVNPEPPPNPAMMFSLQGEDGSPDSLPLSCSAVFLNASQIGKANSPNPYAGPLTRNQNVYTAAMRPGISAEVLSAVKDRDTATGGPLNTFVVGISNGSSGKRRVRLDLDPADPYVSFRRTGETLLSIPVNVTPGSRNVRTVFDSSDDSVTTDDVVLSIYDVTSLVDMSDSSMQTAPGEGTLVARLRLARTSLTPLETVLTDDGLLDVLDSEYYDVELTRETGANRDLTLDYLDLENLDFENTAKLLDLENSAELLDLENLDLENTLIFLDLENLDLENMNYTFLDLENLDLENALVANLDLENDSYTLLDLENLDLENLDLENLDLENLDLENLAQLLDLENLDLENLDLENSTMFLDLENLDLENRFLESLDLENLDLENLDLENSVVQFLDLENLDLENLDLENLDLENKTTANSAIKNLDLENLDLENTAPGDESVEIIWSAESEGNTTTGVDIKPIFSPALANAINAPDSNTLVLLTVRQPYYNSTVSLTSNTDAFCSLQIVAENQVVYSALLTPDQINSNFGDPDPLDPDAPGFFLEPGGRQLVSMTIIRPPAGFTNAETISPNVGLGTFSQPGELICDENIELTGETFDVCDIDYTNPDETAPVITLLGDNPLDIEVGVETYSEPGATAEDDVDGNVSSGIQISGNVDASTIGTYTITYSVTDTSDNTGTTTRTVNVIDTTAPTITAPAAINTEATAPLTTVALGNATAADNSGSVTVTNDATENFPSGFPVGIRTVTWTASDGVRSTTATQQVVVTDTTAPSVILNPLTVDDGAGGTLELVNYTIEAGQAYTELGAVVADLADPAPVLVVSGSVDTTTAGDYVITYTATDTTATNADGTAAASPNTTIVTRTVTVVDNTDPTIDTPLPPPLTPDPATVIIEPPDTTLSISWPITASDAGSTLSLSCTIDGTTTLSPATQTYESGVLQATFDYEFPAGTTTVNCTATDQNGNTATTGNFTVFVEDEPIIDESTLPTLPLEIEADDESGYIGATPWSDILANDGVDPDPIVASCTPSSGFSLGDNTVTCTATDSAGNESEAVTFTVTVVDTTPPVIQTVQPDITLEANAASGYVNGGSGLWAAILADDIYDGSIEASCSPLSTDDFVLGTTTVTCVARDSSGNPDPALNPGDPGFPSDSFTTFDVTVRDTTPPSITAAALPDPTPTLADALEGNTLGGYDPAAASGGALWIEPVPAAADDIVDGSLAVSCSSADGKGPSSFYPLGATDISCTVTDSSSNTATASSAFTVFVGDSTPPDVSISVTGDPVEATGPSGASVSFTASASDVVSGSLATTCSVGGETVTSPHVFGIGTSTLTCTATDGSGVQGSATASVTVSDTTAPAITTTPLVVTTEGTFASVAESAIEAQVTATDIVDGDNVTGSVTVDCPIAPDPKNFDIGTVAVGCTATDSRGNSSSAAVDVIVQFAYDITIAQPKGNIRAGSSVPLDWYYTDPITGLRVNSSALVPKVTWFGAFPNQSFCSTDDSGPEDGSTAADDAGNSDFRYSASDDSWRLNWDTPPTAGYYRVVIAPPGTEASTFCVRTR